MSAGYCAGCDGRPPIQHSCISLGCTCPYSPCKRVRVLMGGPEDEPDGDSAYEKAMAARRAEDLAHRLAVFERLHGLPEGTEPEGPAWISHDEYETRNARRISELHAKGEARQTKSAQESAREKEVHRFREYKSLGGDEKKYVPLRRFPCPGMMRVIMPDFVPDGKPVGLRCDECGFNLTVSGAALNPAQISARRLERIGLPDSCRGRHMDPVPGQENVRLMMRQYIEEFDLGKPSSLVPAPALYGPVGVGKTHLLTLTVEALVRRHEVDAVYYSLRTLLDMLKEQMAQNLTSLWKRVLEIPVLVLDDVGAERPTEWSQDRFAEIVDVRYSKERVILLASNIPPEAWPEAFGHRTASRLRGMTLPQLLDGPDQRPVRRAQADQEGAAADQATAPLEPPPAPPSTPEPPPAAPDAAAPAASPEPAQDTPMQGSLMPIEAQAETTDEPPTQRRSQFDHGLGPAEPTPLAQERTYNPITRQWSEPLA